MRWSDLQPGTVVKWANVQKPSFVAVVLVLKASTRRRFVDVLYTRFDGRIEHTWRGDSDIEAEFWKVA